MIETPVLLIPGYLGTRLRHRRNGRLVWGTFRSLYRTTPDELTGDCEPAGAVERITVIPRVWTHNVYGRLKRAFGSRLIVFPYDWRRSHEETARALARFIERLGRPVHAIAHSTGGYALDYCVRYGDARLEETREPRFPLARCFASLIWVGVPWLGTVAAARDMTLGWRAAPFGRRFPPDMVRKFPSVHEALPTWRSAWRQEDGTATNFDPFQDAAHARTFRESLQRGPRWAPVPSHLIACDRIRTRAAVCLTRRGFLFERYWEPGDGTVTIHSALAGDGLPPEHVRLHLVRGRHRYLLSRPKIVRLLQAITSERS